MSRATHQKYKKLLVKAGLLDGVPEELPAVDQLAGLQPQQRPPQQMSSAAGHEARIRELIQEGSQAAGIYRRL